MKSAAQLLSNIKDRDLWRNITAHAAGMARDNNDDEYYPLLDQMIEWFVCPRFRDQRVITFQLMIIYEWMVRLTVCSYEKIEIYFICESEKK